MASATSATPFVDLTRRVHLINDLILSDMVCDPDDMTEGENFEKHLMATTFWFSRISWSNKKRFLFALLQDVRSVWTLSFILKCTWHSRPKDAVLSTCQPTTWISYDKVPMDHNRTAIPVKVLAQVMKNDRMWFLSLNPEPQALVLLELLTIGGGPIMWEVLNRAHLLYDRYKDDLMESIQELTIVTPDKSNNMNKEPNKGTPGKKESKFDEAMFKKPTSRAQVDLDAKLAIWNATIKSIRDSFKLEEYETKFKNGTTTKMWKVNRPVPEAIETVDFLQLLPASIGMIILSYLPRAQLNDYAKVNKYWAFLVDEFRAELAARIKIDTDFEKIKELLQRRETDSEIFQAASQERDFGGSAAFSSFSSRLTRSHVPSEKSGGAYSLRYFINEKLTKASIVTKPKPIRNMAELNKRLQVRGAADENIWKWSAAVQRLAKKRGRCLEKRHEGILELVNAHFPCPLMKKSIKMPLYPPLHTDPSFRVELKTKRTISNSNLPLTHRKSTAKRYSLWTRDLTSLYPVVKIPSYQFPAVQGRPQSLV